MFIDSVLNLTVTRVVSAHRLLNSPVGIKTYRYNRERWAVALKLCGKTYYTANGKEILSDHLHPVILPKGCSYSWQCTEAGECIMIEFEALTESQTVVPFEITDQSFITNAFAKIEKDLHFPKENGGLECKHLLYGILLTLSKTVCREYLPKGKRALLQPAIGYMTEKYYDSTITNDRLAALCGVSTVYFRKVFEQVYGVPPIKYLHELRLNKARAILLSDYDSIEQIAESVGYNSIYHFSKMFKAHVGMSPSEYAKASRN